MAEDAEEASTKILKRSDKFGTSCGEKKVCWSRETIGKLLVLGNIFNIFFMSENPQGLLSATCEQTSVFAEA